jgi:hypothetical protein
MNLKRTLDDMRTIKQLLTGAERIARELGEEEPGAEHLLLSALELPDGTAAATLARVGVDGAAIRGALVADQAEALVSVGIAPERAAELSAPEPLPDAGRPLLYGAGPTARAAFRVAGERARAARRPLVGADVVAAVAAIERGATARLFARLGVDRRSLADATAGAVDEGS